MTLDDFILALQDLRARCPAAGSATVFSPLQVCEPVYERGCVFLDVVVSGAAAEDDDPDDPDDDEGDGGDEMFEDSPVH